MRISDWSSDLCSSDLPVVTIDGYEAKLAIGDFSARLELEYDQQEFLGSLTLGSDLTGSFELAARVWQDNGETSWIAALQQGDIEADNFILDRKSTRLNSSH